MNDDDPIELPLLGLDGDYYGSDEVYKENCFKTDYILQLWPDHLVTWRKK